MATFLARELEGWGRFPRQNCRVARPEKRRDIADVVLDNQIDSLLARGLGRSYGDAALNENDGVALLEKLDRFLSFDAANGVLEVEAGVSLSQIIETFLPRGWFLPVVPGTKFVTIGGAIGCDVHGKNHHRDGCLSEFINSFDLLIASGETLFCSREQNSEAFWATLGGMGLTGIVTKATIRLSPVETAYIKRSFKRTHNLDETLDEFGHDGDTTYSVAWIDCLSTGSNIGRSVLIRGEHAKLSDLKDSQIGETPLEYESPKAKKIPFDFPSFALNPRSVKAFNAVYYAAHPDEHKIESLEPFFWPLDAVGGWNKIYGARGFVQYQFILPQESSRQGLLKALEKISTSGHAAFLAVLKVHGPQNPAPLSFPLAGHSLALDIPLQEGAVEFCREMDALVTDFGGRVYLAKDATLEPENLRIMYPRTGEFEEIKARLDPNNRFQSSLSRRLKIGASA